MKNLFDGLLGYRFLYMHNSWHCETLPNYHATTVYFGGGKNFLCIMIFVMDKF